MNVWFVVTSCFFIYSRKFIIMKTTFVFLLTALILGFTGLQKVQAAGTEGQPLKITVVEKCEYVEGGVWISSVNQEYEIHEFTTAPMQNYAFFTKNYIPHSGIYMKFNSTYAPGRPEWFKVKVYQDTPSNVLVEKSFSIGETWGDYVTPKPTQFEGEQVNLYIEVTVIR